jgi:hypothetical protein
VPIDPIMTSLFKKILTEDYWTNVYSHQRHYHSSHECNFGNRKESSTKMTKTNTARDDTSTIPSGRPRLCAEKDLIDQAPPRASRVQRFPRRKKKEYPD